MITYPKRIYEKYIGILQYLLFFLFFILIYSCANQLPPSGGEDDKTPPKVISIIPKPNTTKFSGNTIKLKFDKYVDRRSFRESLFISPKPKGDLNFDWGGKDVEISFKGLQNNKTYSFLISKRFKDIYGNSLSAPIQFAISTGDSIDNGSISGKVYSKKSDNIVIFAYTLNGKADSLIDPAKVNPDYLTQVDENGIYSFNHITKAEYMVFSIKDLNKNLIYDKGVDEISVYHDNISLDTQEIRKDINFIFKDALPDEKYTGSSEFINSLTRDTSNFIFSSVKNYGKEISIEPLLFFYFKNNNISKYDIADNVRLFDSTNNKSCKLVFNWLSDSLLQVFPVEKLKFSSTFNLSIDLRKTQRKYLYKLYFTTADEKRFGKISGSVVNSYRVTQKIFVKLYPKNNNVYIHSIPLVSDSVFTFSNLLEGEYNLFAFIDRNDNGIYDEGNAYPYSPSEKFFMFEPYLNLKGNWSIDNVFIRF
jgi:hypothetical protein